MAHRSQCSSAGDNPLDPNYLAPHYREEYRLAIDSLLEEDLDGYYQFLQKADVVDFLAVPEIEYIQCSVKLPQQHSNHPEQHFLDSGGDGSSDTYWPVHSDLDAPGLDLGWPQVHRFIGPTEVTTLVNPPEPDMPSIKEQARRLIKNAQQVIALVMDMFTDVDIFADILSAADRNVAVYILLDDQNAHHFVNMALNCRVNLDSIQFLRVRTVSGITYHCRTGKSFKGQMMDRFLFTDCRAVLSGNYSFMWSFEKIHRCMAHLFLGQLVSTFDEEFRILYAQSEPLVVENVLATMEDLTQVQQKQYPGDRLLVYGEPQKFPAMEVPRPEDLPRHSFDVGMDMDWKKTPLKRQESKQRKLDQGPVDMYNRFPSQQSRMETPFDQVHLRMLEMENLALRRHSFAEGAQGRLPSLQFLQKQGMPDLENLGRQFHRGQPPYSGTGPEPDYGSYDKFWSQGYNSGEQFPEPGLPQEIEPPDNFDPVLHYFSSTANVDLDQGSEKLLPAAEVPFSSSYPKRLNVGKPYASQNSPTPSNQSDQKQSFQEPNTDRKDPVVKRGLRNWRISSYLSAFDNAEDEGLPLPTTLAPDAFEEPPNPIQHTAPGIDLSAPKIPNTREFKIPTVPRSSQIPMFAKPTTREPAKKVSDEVFTMAAEIKTLPTPSESLSTTEDNKPEETESKELKNAALRKDDSFRRNYNAAVQRSSRLRSSLIFSSQLDQQDSKTAPGQQDEDDDKTEADQTKLPFASQVLNQRRPFEWGRYIKSTSFDISTAETSKPDDMSGKAKDKDSTREKTLKQLASFGKFASQISKPDDASGKVADEDSTREKMLKWSTSFGKSATQTSKPDDASGKAADEDSTREKILKQLASFGKSATQTSKPDDASGKAADQDSTRETMLKRSTSFGKSATQASKPDEVDSKADNKDPSREKPSKDLSEKRDLQASVKLADAEQSVFLPSMPQLRLPQIELPIFDLPFQPTKPFLSNPSFIDMNDPDQRLMFFKELAAKRKAANTAAAEKRKEKPVMIPPSHSKDKTAVPNVEPVPEKSSQNKKTLTTSSETVLEKNAAAKDAVETISTEASVTVTLGADVNVKTNKQGSHSKNDPNTPQSYKEEQTRSFDNSDKTGVKDSKSGARLPVSAELAPPQSQPPPEPKLSNPAQKEGSSSVPHTTTDATAPNFPSLTDSRGQGTAKNGSQTLDSISKDSSRLNVTSSETLSGKKASAKDAGQTISTEAHGSVTQGVEVSDKTCRQDGDSKSDPNPPKSCETEQTIVSTTSDKTEVKNSQTGKSLPVAAESAPPLSQPSEQAKLSGPAVKECIINMPPTTTDATAPNLPPLTDYPEQGAARNESETLDSTSKESSRLNVTSSKSLLGEKATAKDAGQTVFTEAHGSVSLGVEVNTKTNQQDSDSKSDPNPPKSSDEEEQTRVSSNSEETEVKNSQTGAPLPVSTESTPPLSQPSEQAKFSSPAVKECIINIPPTITDATAPNLSSLIDSQGQGTAKNGSQTLDSISKDSSRPNVTSSETLLGEKATAKDAGQTISTEAHGSVSLGVEVNTKTNQQDSDSKSDPNPPKSSEEGEQTRVSTNSEKTEVKNSQTGAPLPVSTESTPPLSQPSEQAKLSGPAVKECIINMPPTTIDATAPNLPPLTDSPEQGTGKNESQTLDSTSKDSSRLNITSSETLLVKKATARDAGQTISTEAHGTVAQGVEVNTKPNKQDSDSKSDPNPPKSSDEEEQTRVSTNSEKTEVKKGQTGAPPPVSAESAPPLSQQSEEPNLSSDPPTSSNSTPPHVPSLIDSVTQGTDKNETQTLDSTSKRSSALDASSPGSLLVKEATAEVSGETVSTEAREPATVSVDVIDKTKKQDTHSKYDAKISQSCEEEQTTVVTHSEKVEVKKDQSGASLPVAAKSAPPQSQLQTSSPPVTSKSHIENLGSLQVESSTSSPPPPSDSTAITEAGSEFSASHVSVAASSTDHTLADTSSSQSSPSPSPHGSAPHSTPVETMSSNASQEHSSSAPSSGVLIPTSDKTEPQESASHPSSESSQSTETTSQKSVTPIQTLSDSTQVSSGSVSQLTSSETSSAVDSARSQCNISSDTRADDSEPNTASSQSTTKTDSEESSSLISRSEKDPPESVSDSVPTNATGGSEVSSSVASSSPKDVKADDSVSHTSTPSTEPPDQNVTVPPVTQTDSPPEHSPTETNSDGNQDITSEPSAPAASPSNINVTPAAALTEVIPPSDDTRSGSSNTTPPVTGSSSLSESDLLVVSPKDEKTETNMSTMDSPLETTSSSKLSPSDSSKSPDISPSTQSSSDLIEPTLNISRVPTEPNLPGDTPKSVTSESQALQSTISAENSDMENHCEMSKGSDHSEKHPEDAEGKNNADKSTKQESVSHEKPSDKAKQSNVPEQTEITSGEVAPPSPLSKQPKTTTTARYNSTANVLSSSNLRDDTKLLLEQISANSQSRHDSTKETAVTDDQKGDEADKFAKREKERRSRSSRGQTMNNEERQKLLEKLQSIRKENKVYSRFQMAP